MAHNGDPLYVGRHEGLETEDVLPADFKPWMPSAPDSEAHKLVDDVDRLRRERLESVIRAIATEGIVPDITSDTQQGETDGR